MGGSATDGTAADGVAVSGVESARAAGVVTVTMMAKRKAHWHVTSRSIQRRWVDPSAPPALNKGHWQSPGAKWPQILPGQASLHYGGTRIPLGH